MTSPVGSSAPFCSTKFGFTLRRRFVRFAYTHNHATTTIYVSLFAIKAAQHYTTTQHTHKTKTKIKDRDYKKRVNA